jgi:hypothetical protein
MWFRRRIREARRSQSAKYSGFSSLQCTRTKWGRCALLLLALFQLGVVGRVAGKRKASHAVQSERFMIADGIPPSQQRAVRDAEPEAVPIT